MSPPVPRITALETALPKGEIDGQYRHWAANRIGDPRTRRLFQRMSERGAIARRYTVLGERESHFDAESFYGGNSFPATSDRMKVYARTAPDLAMEAISGLPDVQDVTHIVFATCTGFMAPGLDQIVARRLGLSPSVERVAIGFMGCYAGVTALRTAAHLVRSDPRARVLVISVELCTLHLQDTDDLEALLAMGQFADGAAAAIVSAEGEGLALGASISETLEESDELISWIIGDSGFVMHLSGAVPGRIAAALEKAPLLRTIAGKGAPPHAWAVHPGGRSILDAVERGAGLADRALDHSRGVLHDCGNMSSATILFVLRRFLEEEPESGVALAFGPGLAVEGLRFGWVGDAR